MTKIFISGSFSFKVSNFIGYRGFESLLSAELAQSSQSRRVSAANEALLPDRLDSGCGSRRAG